MKKTTLSEKENYLRVMRGEMPEWLPRRATKFRKGLTAPSTGYNDVRIEPRVTSKHRYNMGGLDIWGVEHVTTPEAAGGLMPKTHDFILTDIRKWRDVIKAPDISNIDWEKACKEDFDYFEIDRSTMAITMNTHMGYFQLLMSYMGFTEGMCALHEEPEEVMALFEYLCDFYCEVSARYIDHCKPDIWQIADDTAAWTGPMISPEMYRNMLIPFYKRQVKFGIDRGLPISVHNCGMAGAYMEDLTGIGITSWEPAQSCNDLRAIKAKYGRKLALLGGWDARGSLLRDDVTYEEIFESIKTQVDILAPGGGYCFGGGFLGVPGDMRAREKNEMIMRVYEEIKYDYY